LSLPPGGRELVELMVQGPMTPGDLESMFRDLQKAAIGRALGAELIHHLDYAKGGAYPEEHANQRNGSTGKTVLTDDGPLRVDIPRDRDGSFAPLLIGKHRRRFTGFDDKSIAMCARRSCCRQRISHMPGPWR
jgi:putative transposase